MKALISGATRGIGRAIAKRFAKEGIDLILLARGKAQLKQLKGELETDASCIQIVSINLSKTEEILSLKDEINLDNISILVNNLGVYSIDNATEINSSQLKNLLDINLFSAIDLTRLVVPNLKKNKKGIIINIGSVMSLVAENHASSYSISKHALKGWNDSLREELRRENIKVSCIYPGSVNTSSWDGLDVNKKLMIQAEDIAELVFTTINLGKSSLVEEIRLSPLDFNF